MIGIKGILISKYRHKEMYTKHIKTLMLGIKKTAPHGTVLLKRKGLLLSLGSTLGLGFALVDLLLIVDGEEHSAYSNDEEADGDRMAGDGHEVAAVEVHEADEVLLTQQPLLADSVEATPCGMPVPHFSGYLLKLLLKP